MPRLGAARQNRQCVASASSHPSLGNSARLSRLKGHWAKPFRGVEAPQSLTSKFSEHRPVFFAQALIKSFQSKMGFSISSEDLQHNVDKSHRGQPGHGQISLWSAQPTGAKPADQPKFHVQLYNKKHQKANKRFTWKKPSGDIGSHCAFYKERTISECRAWSKSPGRQPWAQIQEHT